MSTSVIFMRYKEILTKKVEEEKREEKKQEKLKEAAGISDSTITVKKNTAWIIFKNIIRNILSTVKYVLVAIGVLTIIEPNMRTAFLSILQKIF